MQSSRKSLENFQSWRDDAIRRKYDAVTKESIPLWQKVITTADNYEKQIKQGTLTADEASARLEARIKTLGCFVECIKTLEKTPANKTLIDDACRQFRDNCFLDTNRFIAAVAQALNKLPLTTVIKNDQQAYLGEIKSKWEKSQPKNKTNIEDKERSEKNNVRGPSQHP